MIIYMRLPNRLATMNVLRGCVGDELLLRAESRSRLVAHYWLVVVDETKAVEYNTVVVCRSAARKQTSVR